MKKTVIALAVMTLAACTPQNPLLTEWDTPYGIPPFDEIKVSDYLPAIQTGIAENVKEIEEITSNKEPATFENTIAAYELAGQTLTKVIGVLYNVAESDNSPELEEVMNEVTPLLTEHSDNIFMNPALYKRVAEVYNADQSSLTREQQVVLKEMYQTFTRNGIGLSEEKQAELREINKKLAVAEQKFGNNLLAENNAFKEICGIPVSSYTATMTTSADREYREKLFKTYTSRGNNANEYDNKALCIEILKLRAQKAQILGFKTFADYQLDNKMAHDPQTVDAFLAKIMDAAVKRAKEEIYDFQKVMDRDVAAGLLPAGSKIEPWDLFYYAEKVRAEKYALDESITRPYFKLENVRDGVFYAAKLLYGVNVEELKDVPVYNPEVKAYKLTEDDGSLIGIFFADYLPRSSKRGGAWMNNFRNQYRDAQGNDVRPIIVNVCNFTPPTEDKPSLLTIDEVGTAFHEFGHALHGFLSKCNYSSVSGTSVKRDFVETFSQFNENWAFQPEILAKYAFHYQTGEVIPAELVDKINASSKFFQGFMTTEVAAASILDMQWHELSLEQLEELTPETLMTAQQSICNRMGLIEEIVPRYCTTYFNHIFNSGYSAGYYSYLWAEVLDKDAFEYFQSQGIYNPEVARKFRETFLEKGGSEEPMVLYESFRGAQPDPEALVRARGL